MDDDAGQTAASYTYDRHLHQHYSSSLLPRLFLLRLLLLLLLLMLLQTASHILISWASSAAGCSPARKLVVCECAAAWPGQPPKLALLCSACSAQPALWLQFQ